jgi:hypothetical protein
MAAGGRPVPLFPHTWHGIVVLFCVFSLFPGGGSANELNDITRQKRVLTEKLDSLDLEKQLRKRRGESLEDLEKAAEMLKDSIAVIKRRMPSSGESAEQIEDSAGPSTAASAAAEGTKGLPGRLQQFQKFLPKTFFDWMVDIVAFIAIISGIVLVIGVFGLLSRGFKKKKKAAVLQKPLHEIFPRSYAADAYDRIPKVPTGRTEENNEDISSLRKRMDEAPLKAPGEAGVLATVDGASFGASGRESDPQELKKPQVLEASRQGLDVSEISRRFHLSADEVSLILRMARKDDTRPQ